MLTGLPRATDPDLLVGFGTDDDAAAYKVSDTQVLLQTVDFFPPMVDDPYTFGAIAATNALSDIYAMGGTPKLALNLFAFPSDKLPPSAANAILKGGADKVLEAGALLCGGHTIEDKEPKYGLCVTGFVHPDKLLRNDTARPGDVLILTKPLGSGILSTAAKAEMLEKADYDAMVRVMTTLNAAAQQAMLGVTVHACTDITGFALLGHACEMASGSGVTIALHASGVPVMDAALSFADMGLVPGGAYRNRDHFGHSIAVEESVPRALQDVLFDPQTAGGLLISVASEDAKALLAALCQASSWPRIIGQVQPFDGMAVRVYKD